jgi:outer membrane protein insertion porin family
MKKLLLAGLVASVFSQAAWSFQPFQIRDIRVEGIQRTEAGTVFSYLPVKVGDTMTDDKAAQAIKTLFATGFFKDVRLEIEGSVLVVVLEERPAVASLEFSGLKSFKAEDIKKSLREVGLAESRIFDRSLVERAEQELKRQYLNLGYYAVEITTTVTPLERNRVGVNFAVSEGEVAKIKQISIIGANAYKEADLLDLFVLRSPGLLTWYTKNDRYSKQKLTGDLETLKSYYLDRGFLEFHENSTQVSISPDKQDIYIAINITEGDQFKVAGVKLAGELLVPEDDLRKLVKLKPGEIFSRERLTETTKAISDRLGNEGYAFANVNAAPEFDRAKQEVAFTLFVDPGRRVNVRRVNVVGNTKTRDEVVRREVRQMESSWYDGEKINLSRKRVERLGYFDEVNFETPAVAGTTDQVDVEIKVKEKPTGNLMLGAGFSSTDKFVAQTSIQQQNLFGSGKHLGAQFSTSKTNQAYSISHTDPYYTTDGVALGFDAYTRKTDTNSTATGRFGSKSVGGGLRLGFPYSEEDFINGGLSFDVTKLTVDSTSPVIYQNYVNQYGASNKTLLAMVAWQKDGRDSVTYTTEGTYRRATFEASTPGSTATFWRGGYQHQRFFPLTPSLTLAVNGEIGIAKRYGTKDLPFNRYYYAGGIGSVRGYDGNSLGPKDPISGASLGGSTKAIGNVEALFPFPGMGKDRSLRLSVFADAGMVDGDGKSVKFGGVKTSTGMAVAWNSPMGPMKFSYALPLNATTADKKQQLQFQMGTSF